jgi:hypothetical protein
MYLTINKNKTMKNVRSSLLVALGMTMCSFMLMAQKAPVKWGKIDQEDMSMTIYDQDTSASAVILADFGSLSFDFSSGDSRYQFERHTRIKIINRSGFDYGDIVIPFYHDEKVSQLKAHLIAPDGTKHEVKRSEIFEEKTSENWSRMKFSFPQMTEGAVIEYKYMLTSDHILTLQDWYFQRAIPTRHSELRLSIPEWYNYVFLTQGRKADIEEKETSTQTLRVPTVKYRSYSGYVRTQTTTVNTISAEVKTYRYVMKDIPAFHEEAFITTKDDHLSRLKFQLQSVIFPGQTANQIFSTWPVVAKELAESDYFGLQYTQKSRCKKFLKAIDPVLAKGETPTEKVLLAYNYINSNIKWNGNHSMGAQEDIDKCFELKEASTGELNLMMLAVCEHLGIEAYPLLMSTREHGKMIELYPILDQFNHLAVAVLIDGNLQLVDLGNPNRPIGLPRVNSLNGRAWVASQANPQWIDLVPPKSSDTEMFDLNFEENGEVSFTMKGKYEGYDAAKLREKIHTDKQAKFLKEAWEGRYPEVTIDSIMHTNADDPYAALEVNLNGQLPGLVQSINDFMYISPILNPVFDENPLKLESRAYPVNIPYPFKTQSLVFIEKPEGYAAEELPESIRLSLPNGGGKFEYLVNDAGAKISVITKLELKQLVFQAEEYETIKNFFDLIIEKQGEQLVFIKKT